MHLILLRRSSWEEMNAPSRIPLHLQRARPEGPLFAHKDVEIVVCSVQTRVSFCAERRPEDDEVLGDARVDNVHRAHGSARVVEHPLT